MRAGAERSAGSLVRAMRATRRSCSSRADRQVPEGNQLRWRRRQLRRSARLRRAIPRPTFAPSAPRCAGRFRPVADRERREAMPIPRRATYAPAPKKKVPTFAQARSLTRGARDSRRRDEGLSRAAHRAFRATRTETPPGEASLPARAVLAVLRRIAARGRPLQAAREYKNRYRRRRSLAFRALRYRESPQLRRLHNEPPNSVAPDRETRRDGAARAPTALSWARRCRWASRDRSVENLLRRSPHRTSSRARVRYPSFHSPSRPLESRRRQTRLNMRASSSRLKRTIVGRPCGQCIGFAQRCKRSTSVDISCGARGSPATVTLWHASVAHTRSRTSRCFGSSLRSSSIPPRSKLREP